MLTNQEENVSTLVLPNNSNVLVKHVIMLVTGNHLNSLNISMQLKLDRILYTTWYIVRQQNMVDQVHAFVFL